MTVKPILPTDIQALAELFKLPSYDEISENRELYSDMYYVKKNLINEGLSEEEAETQAYIWLEKEEQKLYSKYAKTVIKLVSEGLEAHGLSVFLCNNHFDIVIQRKCHWKVISAKIKNTINAYGIFYFKSAKDLKISYPYNTYKETVGGHLHWVASWHEIYYGSTYLAEFNRNFY